MTNATPTTLVSLFHTEDLAQQTLAELRSAGIPASAITTLSNADGAGSATQSSLQNFELPESDMRMLADGIRDGGSVIVVSADDETADEVEAIFRKYHSHKVDEQVLEDGSAAHTGASLRDDALMAAPLAGDRSGMDRSVNDRSGAAFRGETTIPVVEEQLVVGKRAVQAGGVRVVSHVVETPVTETVKLREEHARVERRPVDRAATEADFRAPEDIIEVLETSEQAVVEKTARVVEEVVIGKEASQRTEKVTDTVRKTEVEVEQLAGETLDRKKKRS